jgi:hypothetical protein
MAAFPTREADAVKQGPGWVFLDWKEPADGGKPSAYLVEQREMPDGPWTHAQTVMPSEATWWASPAGRVWNSGCSPATRRGTGR